MTTLPVAAPSIVSAPVRVDRPAPSVYAGANSSFSREAEKMFLLMLMLGAGMIVADYFGDAAHAMGGWSAWGLVLVGVAVAMELWSEGLPSEP